MRMPENEGDDMQQLYAKVKKNSRYFDQNKMAQRMGEFPFRVLIKQPDTDGFCVKGGPGGQYRMADVNLFVKVDEKEIRIK